MKLQVAVLGTLLFGSGLIAYGQSDPKPDNTKVNKRDRQPGEATADKQKMNKADRELTQNIRKAIIADKLGVDEKEITPQASFTNDLGADSLDTVELIMEFEKEFNIAIPDDQAEKISTVGEAVTYIQANVK